MKSLIIDDDNTCRYIFQALLSKYGQSDVFSNAFDAIEAYKTSLNKENPYELILIDIMMPEMNGYEVLQNIRLLEEERNISFPYNAKIILTTGLDDIENRQIEQKLDAQSETYLIKSSDHNALYEKLNLFGFYLD